MKDVNERVTLRLESDNLERMDSYVSKTNEFTNRSQFLRQAIEAFIDHAERAHEEVSVRIPAKYLEYIDASIEEGYFLSREQAVLRCIEEFLSLDNLKKVEEHKRKIGEASKKIVSVDYGDKSELLER